MIKIVKKILPRQHLKLESWHIIYRNDLKFIQNNKNWRKNKQEIIFFTIWILYLIKKKQVFWYLIKCYKMFRFNFKNENKGVNSLTCLDLISKIENKGVNSSFWSCLKQFFLLLYRWKEEICLWHKPIKKSRQHFKISIWLLSKHLYFRKSQDCSLETAPFQKYNHHVICSRWVYAADAVWFVSTVEDEKRRDFQSV